MDLGSTECHSSAHYTRGTMLCRILFCCLLVGAVVAIPGWENGRIYEYVVRGRTLTALHQVANQFTGIMTKALFRVEKKSDTSVLVQLMKPHYVHLNTILPGGFDEVIDDRRLSWKPIPMVGDPVHLNLDRYGMVQNMTVSSNTMEWEANMLKGIISQLQLTVKENRNSDVPARNMTNSLVYSVTEKLVTGECEVLYEVVPYSHLDTLAQPEMLNVSGVNTTFLSAVIKTQHYTSCKNRRVYHFGFNGFKKFQPGENKGGFMSRSTVSRVIIAGSLKKYIILSALGYNKVLLSPELYNNQQGIAASRLNLTLVSVTSGDHIRSVPNGRSVGDLVYRYPSFSRNESIFNKNNAGYSLESDENGSSSSSSSSSDSSSQENASNSTSSSSSSSSSSSEQNTGRKPSSRRRPEGTQAFKPRHQMKKEYPPENASDEFEEFEEESRYRRRRSIRNKQTFTDNISRRSSSSSESRSYSSEESEEVYRPPFEEAPHIPLLPFFEGLQGQSISNVTDSARIVVKLAMKIGYDLQNPSTMPEQHTLSRFTIMARILRTMSYPQFVDASKKLYPYGTSNSLPKIDAWKSFRDAVAQAGTIPALRMIKDWVDQNKIKGEEAAQVIGVLPHSVRTPTVDYLDVYFEMIKNSNLRKEKYLNESLVISFSQVIHDSVVDNVTSSLRFPVHVFGRMVPKNYYSEGSHKFIAYLGSLLNDATKKKDFPNIQLYIRALGLTGHPDILKYFRPYLEGKYNITDHQRHVIVVSMKELAQLHPEYVVDTLLALYHNTKEIYEVRVAAAVILIKSNPPVSVYQEIAEFTNYDVNHQVISAVQSAIRTAASLEGPNTLEMARKAKAAVNLLNPKKMDTSYSSSYFKNYNMKDLDLGYEHYFSYTGSKDSFHPKAVFYNLISNIDGGRQSRINFEAMVSSISDLFDLLGHQFFLRSNYNYPSQGSKSEATWSNEIIEHLFNMSHERSKPVEGNILYNFAGAKRVFTFDKHTIENVPRVLKRWAQDYKYNRRFNYTKFFDRASVTLAFPNIMGLPFQYTLKTPTLLKLEGDFKFQTYPTIVNESHKAIAIPEHVNVTADVHFVYAFKYQNKISFVTPFDNMTYIAGVHRNVQYNIPVKSNFDLDIRNKKLQVVVKPLDNRKHYKLVHWSTVPYTTYHDIRNIIPVLNDTNTKIIHVRDTKVFKNAYGKPTGMKFDFRAETDQEFVDFKWLYDYFQMHDSLSPLYYSWVTKAIFYNKVTVVFNPDESTAHVVKLIASYGEKGNRVDQVDPESEVDQEIFSAPYQRHKSRKPRSARGKYNKEYMEEDESGSSEFEEWSNPMNLADPGHIVDPDSQSRRREFLAKASALAGNASAVTVDFVVLFEGSTKASFLLTSAYAHSRVNKSHSLLVFLQSLPVQSHDSDRYYHQACFSGKFLKPHVPIIDYHAALDFNPKSRVEAHLNFGETCSTGAVVNLEGVMERSKQQHEFVSKLPLAKEVCETQMSAKNYLLPACRNVTQRASNLDMYHLEIKYKNVSVYWKNLTYQAYTVVRHLGYPYFTENFFPHNPRQNFVLVDFHVNKRSSAFNVTVETPALYVNFTNIRLQPWVRPLLKENPQYSVWDRLGQYFYPQYYRPTCVVDGTLINTFDNRTYSARLSNCWHLMFKYIPKFLTGYNNAHDASANASLNYIPEISVSVKEIGSKKMVEVLVYNSTFILKPPTNRRSEQVEVQFDGRVIKFSPKYEVEIHKSNLLVALLYALPSGAAYLTFPLHKLVVVYDGERVMLYANNMYRDKIRGLCGTMDGEPSDDFKTPMGCIALDPQYFVSTYVIANKSCEDSSRFLKQRFSNNYCIHETVSYTRLVNSTGLGGLGRMISSSESAESSSSSSSSSSESASNSASNSSSESGSNSRESSSSSSSSESGDNPNVASNPSSNFESNEQQGSMRPHKEENNGFNQPNVPESCMSRKIKQVRDEGVDCFSKYPLPVCSAGCHSVKYVRKLEQFYCVESKQAAEHYAKLVKKGVSPDFRRVGESRFITVEIPVKCVLNSKN